MLDEKPPEQGRIAAGDDQPRIGRTKSSAGRVRALRERRRAAGKRLISVYLSQEEFRKLRELASHFGRPVGGTVGAVIRNCWERYVAAKSNLPR